MVSLPVGNAAPSVRTHCPYCAYQCGILMGDPYEAEEHRVQGDPHFPVINPRYREDWVGLSDVWLAAMGNGVVGAALDDVVAEVGSRRAIMMRRIISFVACNVSGAFDAICNAYS